MNIDLHYDKQFISLQIPDRNVEHIIRPWQTDRQPENASLIREALDCQSARSFRKEIADKNLCVLTEDGTREVPIEDILPPLCELLAAAAHVQFIIATGTHNACTPENQKITQLIESAARSAAIENFTVHPHDCRRENFHNLGKTSRRTNLLVTDKADSAEIFLALSDIKTHYFAGYSNPIKNFVPGICSFETTEQNHSLALDENATFCRHPWHPNPKRQNNPLADDQLEAMNMILQNRPAYTLATISTAGKLQWAEFGDIRSITTRAIEQVDRNNTHTVTPTPGLIVSPGGFPNDINLYIAQRALELTKNAVTDNGEILFLSACPGGIGEKHTIENFYNRLTAPIDQILKSIESDYKLYSHKPYKFAQLIRRLRKIWVHTMIPDSIIQAAHLYPTHSPMQIINTWLAEDPDTKITIVDGANKIALY